MKKAGRVVPVIALGLLLAASVAPACKGVVVETIKPDPPPSIGEIGDPCQHHGDGAFDFAGYKVSEEYVEDRFKACNSGICLTNHVQGRVDCPLGQEAPPGCTGPNDTSCGSGSSCVAAGQYGPLCYYKPVDGGPPELSASTCESGVCNDSPRHACQCTSDMQCPLGAYCDPTTQECTKYVCHHAGECQSAEATDAENAGKSCCVGGADVPVIKEVCGQCEKGSGRNVVEDTYCSCRCGRADGAPLDDAELCACPFGFECSLIRPYVGLGDPADSGKFCIKLGTAFTDASQCGTVNGHLSSSCAGVPAN